MRISDWSSDVCSSDLRLRGGLPVAGARAERDAHLRCADDPRCGRVGQRLVDEVDEAGRPATAVASDPAPVERAAPTVLGDDDLVVGDELLDVGDVAARADAPGVAGPRSEARRVGKECGGTCRSRWRMYDQKEKQKSSAEADKMKRNI